MKVPPFIVTDPSAAIPLFTHVTFNIPLFIIKLLPEAPLIPFLIFPLTIRVPVPLIVRLEPDLNLIPAPSKSLDFHLFLYLLLLIFLLILN